MHVLITNNTLDPEAGSENSARDTAFELQRRGHRVSAYSTQLGRVADSLAEGGIEVFSDLGSMRDQPDVIHGHHEWETSLAAIRWPETPLLSFRRGVDPWQESPCLAPWTSFWIGVDEPCCQHLIEADRRPSDQVLRVLNGIRLEPAPAPRSLPPRPETALVFSNYASEEKGNFLSDIRVACAAVGLELEVIGKGVGNVHPNPLEILPDFDLVFAKGRAALEALAAGCAVIVCDTGGIGPYVTPPNFEDLRAQSFYYDCAPDPVTPELTKARIAEWDAPASERVAQTVRESCTLRSTVDRLEDIYQAASEVHATPARETVATFSSKFLADKGLAYKLGRDVTLLYREHKGFAAPKSTHELAKERDRALNVYRKGLRELGGSKQK